MVKVRFLFLCSMVLCICLAGFAQDSAVEKSATTATTTAQDIISQTTQSASVEQPKSNTASVTLPPENVQPPAKVEPQVTVPPVKEEAVKGIIKEIAEDGSFIMIENTKVNTSKEFLEDSYLEVGDNVEVIADKTEAGLKAKSYNYIFEEEAIPSGTENIIPTTIEAPSKSK